MLLDIYFCVVELQFHAALVGCTVIDFVASLVEELERGLAVSVGDEEVGLRDDVHADEHVVIIKLGAKDFYIVHDLSVREDNMNLVRVGLLVAADAHKASSATGLETKAFDNAG